VTATECTRPPRRNHGQKIQLLALLLSYLAMLSGWAVIFLQQVNGDFLPKSLLAQFGDVPILGPPLYDRIDRRRGTVHQTGARYYGERGSGKYCAASRRWTSGFDTHAHHVIFWIILSMAKRLHFLWLFIRKQRAFLLLLYKLVLLVLFNALKKRQCQIKWWWRVRSQYGFNPHTPLWRRQGTKFVSGEEGSGVAQQSNLKKKGIRYNLWIDTLREFLGSTVCDFRFFGTRVILFCWYFDPILLHNNQFLMGNGCYWSLGIVSFEGTALVASKHEGSTQGLNKKTSCTENGDWLFV